jgi:tRNA(Ile)-lysidine synthase
VTSLEKRVLQSIRETRMLVPGDRVGVAVSGGGDSVALVRLLERLREELGITVFVIHFDHGLRGPESEADARFVERLARERGLELILERSDVAATAARHKWNLEDAARRLRYAFFTRVVEEGRATRIAVAHTQDDQAETVLAHLLRGTGPAGLAGIYPVAGAIVRPLLGHRRDELREYLRDFGQDWREDSTNLDARRGRARIRHQLVPLLEHDFSPLAVHRLARLARLSREEQQFWNALVQDRFRSLVRKDGGALLIRVPDLMAPLDLFDAVENASARAKTHPQLALTERLIRRLYECVRGEPRGLTAERVSQVIRLACESASGRCIELPGGVRVERSFSELIFSRASSTSRLAISLETRNKRDAYHYVVELPARGAATVSVPELNSRFCLKVIDWPIPQRDTTGERVVLDADLLRGPLILRSWQPGDAYRPHGRRQRRKLKSMFLADRIPVRERASWPVLESAGRVVWARGMPPAAEYCAGKVTRAGVVIEEQRLSE